MVLHDISDNTKLVEVTTTSLSAKWLFEDNLDIVDWVSVPASIKEAVSESQDQQILDHLFAQIVINAENLIFGPIRGQSFLKLSRACKIFTEWFFDLLKLQ